MVNTAVVSIPEVTEKMIMANIVVKKRRRPVTVVNGNRFRACFPNTVELPQLNAANKASNAAIVVLSSQSVMGVAPKVTRYPPIIATMAKPMNR